MESRVASFPMRPDFTGGRRLSYIRNRYAGGYPKTYVCVSRQGRSGGAKTPRRENCGIAGETFRFWPARPLNAFPQGVGGIGGSSPDYNEWVAPTGSGHRAPRRAES